ncbi:MAG TPA: hypothetical protein VH350_03530 [Candidatus Sulfotelmatobacter sp.]|jgi:tetratricopeptide (TPR) repeat protein|nr:hypothetical protein [Candidatus Sulfotelmatobacter sp.]
MRSLLLISLLACLATAQTGSSSNSAPTNSQTPEAPASKPQDSTPGDSAATQSRTPNLLPPRSDKVRADELSEGESSSKDTKIDLSPPPDDEKTHPQSSEILRDATGGAGSSDVGEFHPWDPHKAAKDIEVGDFYFKRKNYRAAGDRYREAIYYKENDAVATFRLALCLEKMDQPEEALKEFESYLKILPHGPQAEDARKAIERLSGTGSHAKAGK